jgi:hypothetical protein
MSVLPFRLKREVFVKTTQSDRNEDPKTASIILPVYLWELVDKDAKRCRRSRNKHLEALLVRYFNIESSVDLDEESLATAPDREASVSPKRLKKAG